MEKVALTQSERKLLLGVANMGTIYAYDLDPASRSAAARSLEQKGFLRCAFVEGGDIDETAQLTPAGRDYITFNPKLRNPINWTLVFSAITAACALTGVVIGLVACNM